MCVALLLLYFRQLNLNTGHYEMWNVGIRYNDLSLANFQYRVEGGQKIGVLSDWDLPVTTDEREKVLERIGTVPYKALDLLKGSRPYRSSSLYRHDLETFAWILVWTVLCHAENKRREIYFDRQTWLSRNDADIYMDKLAFFWSMEYVQPPPSRTQEWTLAQELFWDLMKIRMDMKKGIPEKDTKEVFCHHWEVVEEAELSDSVKDMVLALKPRF